MQPDDEQQADCCPFGSASTQHAARAACRLRPDLRPAATLLTTQARTALPMVMGFVDGTFMYILSQQWFDHIAIYVLQLHPPYFCDTKESPLVCRPEAPLRERALFVLALVPTRRKVVRKVVAEEGAGGFRLFAGYQW